MTAEEITAALGGRWFPAGYGNSPCPAHGSTSGSLTIKDDSTEPAGIFVKCHAGCHSAAVRATLESLGLISGDHGPAPVIDPEIIRKKKSRRRGTTRGLPAQRGLALGHCEPGAVAHDRRAVSVGARY